MRAQAAGSTYTNSGVSIGFLQRGEPDSKTDIFRVEEAFCDRSNDLVICLLWKTFIEIVRTDRKGYGRPRAVVQVPAAANVENLVEEKRARPESGGCSGTLIAFSASDRRHFFNTSGGCRIIDRCDYGA